MKTNLILALSLFLTYPILAQELSLERMTESFRLLESAPQGPIVSCFDYSSRGTVISRTEDAGSCPRPYQRIAVGKHRKMNRDIYRSGDYVIARPETNKYQAILNLNFRSETPGLAEMMLERTRNCLNEMKPFMKGPGGEDFEIVITTPDQALPRGVPRPDRININVTQENADYRGNANNFGSQFQCFTIGHEILHHLGLCDEYHEGKLEDTAGNVTADWSCRPVTTEPSFMRNMRFAYDQSVPQTARCECDQKCQTIMRNESAKNIYLSMNAQEILVDESSMVAPNTVNNPNRQLCVEESTSSLASEVIPEKAFEYAGRTGNDHRFNSHRVFATDDGRIFYERIVHKCSCPPGHPYCERMVQQLRATGNQEPKRATCPVGTTSRSTSPSIGNDPSGSRLDETECRGEGANRVCDLVVTNPGNGESLLKPAHFNRILAGDCQGGAPSYERCEQFAYIGRGERCNEMPPECNTDSYYLNGILNPSASGQ